MAYLRVAVAEVAEEAQEREDDHRVGEEEEEDKKECLHCDSYYCFASTQ